MTLVQKVNSGYCKLKGEKTAKKKETDVIKEKRNIQSGAGRRTQSCNRIGRLY